MKNTSIAAWPNNVLTPLNCTYTPNTWLLVSIELNYESEDGHIWIGGQYCGNIPFRNLGNPDAYNKTGFTGSGGGKGLIHFDAFRVRLLIEPEPTYSFDSKEVSTGSGIEGYLRHNIIWTTGLSMCESHDDCDEDYHCTPLPDSLVGVCNPDFITKTELEINEVYPEGLVIFVAGYSYNDILIPNATGTFTIRYKANNSIVDTVTAEWNEEKGKYTGVTSLTINEYNVSVELQSEPYYASSSDEADFNVIFMELKVLYPEEYSQLSVSKIYPSLSMTVPEFYLTAECRWVHNTRTTGWFVVTNEIPFNVIPIELINGENYLKAECILGDMMFMTDVTFETTAIPDPYLLGINLNTHLLSQEGLYEWKEMINAFGVPYAVLISVLSVIVLLGYIFISTVNNVFRRDKNAGN